MCLCDSRLLFTVRSSCGPVLNRVYCVVRTKVKFSLDEKRDSNDASAFEQPEGSIHVMNGDWIMLSIFTESEHPWIMLSSSRD